jgi:predicted nucleotidyltransferase component of viral defense system
MFLSRYEKRIIGKEAEESGFIRDTLEKVYRLVDILEYINQNSLLKNTLALKGGTAINLLLFNLPRLSIDIDLDYCKEASRDEMLQEREVINNDILSYMQTQGYSLSPKAKNPHSLDSWVFEFINSGGNKDIIKIEINYSMRAHVFPAKEFDIVTDVLSSSYKVTALMPVEIFGSKINALINRAAARDLYDVNNMVRFGLFSNEEYSMLRKCIVFYNAVSSKEVKIEFDLSNIDKITQYKIRTDLKPVLRRKERFDLELGKKSVKEFIKELLTTLSSEEREFLQRFANKEYHPELLFHDKDIVNRLSNHPMAIWKTMNSKSKLF